MKKVINLEVRDLGDGERGYFVTSTKNVTSPIPGETIDQIEMSRLAVSIVYDVNIKSANKEL